MELHLVFNWRLLFVFFYQARAFKTGVKAQFEFILHTLGLDNFALWQCVLNIFGFQEPETPNILVSDFNSISHCSRTEKSHEKACTCQSSLVFAALKSSHVKSFSLAF